MAHAIEARTTWILGSGRSGTTWLAALLGAITGGTRVDEPLIGAHLGAALETVTGVSDPDGRNLHDLSGDRLDYVFADAAVHVWGPAVHNLITAHFAHVVGAKGGGASADMPIIVKEPNGSRGAKLLLMAMPRSRLIFLVRDGRDVVDSVLDGMNGGWMTEGVGYSATSPQARAELLRSRATAWARSVDTVQRAYDDHDPSRRLLVTYEALREDTAVEVARIVRWMGFQVDQSGIEEMVRRTDFDAIRADQRGPGKFARAATPGLWKQRFSAAEIERLEAIMGETLVRHGYEVSPPVG